MPLHLQLTGTLFSRLDTVLIVDIGQKKVSSTSGHGLMKGHPFAIQRFEQAHIHPSNSNALTKGDVERFIDLTEAEALCLHAMMTSNPRLSYSTQYMAIIQKYRTSGNKPNYPYVLVSMLERMFIYSTPPRASFHYGFYTKRTDYPLSKRSIY